MRRSAFAARPSRSTRSPATFPARPTGRIAQNLNPDGTFRPAATLRAEFAALVGDRPLDTVVHQCGSGVTACHNQLAMEMAGLAGTRLYPGSWSEWVADPTRPVAAGG